MSSQYSPRNILRRIVALEDASPATSGATLIGEAEMEMTWDYVGADSYWIAEIIRSVDDNDTPLSLAPGLYRVELDCSVAAHGESPATSATFHLEESGVPFTGFVASFSDTDVPVSVVISGLCEITEEREVDFLAIMETDGDVRVSGSVPGWTTPTLRLLLA